MTISTALLKALADRAPRQEPTRTSRAKDASFDLAQILVDSEIDIHKVKHEPDGRTIYEVDCRTSTAHTEGAFFTHFPDGGIDYSCHHDRFMRWQGLAGCEAPAKASTRTTSHN